MRLFRITRDANVQSSSHEYFGQKQQIWISSFWHQRVLDREGEHLCRWENGWLRRSRCKRRGGRWSERAPHLNRDWDEERNTRDRGDSNPHLAVSHDANSNNEEEENHKGNVDGKSNNHQSKSVQSIATRLRSAKKQYPAKATPSCWFGIEVWTSGSAYTSIMRVEEKPNQKRPYLGMSVEGIEYPVKVRAPKRLPLEMSTHPAISWRRPGKRISQGNSRMGPRTQDKDLKVPSVALTLFSPEKRNPMAVPKTPRGEGSSSSNWMRTGLYRSEDMARILPRSPLEGRRDGSEF